MTDWDHAYMNKPTNTDGMYPTTEAMMDALEQAALEHRVTVIARVLTGIIFVTAAITTYVLYPELLWALKQYL